MAIYKKGDITLDSSKHTTTHDDLLSQGFSLQDTPPVANTIPNETATIAPTPEPPKVEPQVFNKEKITQNIADTFTKYTGSAQANKAFVDGVTRLVYGANATPEQLQANEGQTLDTVIKNLGATDLLQDVPGMGLKAPEAPDELKAPPVSPTLSAIDNLLATKQAGLGEQVDINKQLTEKQEANEAVEIARQAIADKKLLDMLEIEKIGDRVIPMSAIRGQQEKYSKDQQIDNFVAVQDYNNKLILAKMAEGNFLEAQRINQSIASDMYEIEKLKIDRAVEQQRITENEATLLRQEEQTAFDRAEAGFIQIDQATFNTLPESQRLSVGGKLYRTPVEDTTNDFQFIAETDTQAGGYFNKKTGQFTLFNTSGDGTGIVSTSTGDMYDIGSYATDPNHEASVQKILSKMGQFRGVEDIDNYIQSVAPGSPITGQMVKNASEKYQVSWEMLTAIMQQDSSLGTKGIGARNHNPGNVGQFDSLGTTPTEGYKTWQQGVDAAAGNLAWRKVGGKTLDKEVSAFVDQVQNGAITANQALNEVSPKKKADLIEALASVPTPTDTDADLLAKQKMMSAIALKDHKGLNSSVGPNTIFGGSTFTRTAIADQFGEKQDFIGKIEQLISDLSLESLIEAKSRGATFGALSDTEMQILSNAATTMAKWRKEDWIGTDLDGYDISEKRFKEELDNISKIFKRAIQSTITEQEELPANSVPIEMPDGTQWIENEDGSMTLVN